MHKLNTFYSHSVFLISEHGYKWVSSIYSSEKTRLVMEDNNFVFNYLMTDTQQLSFEYITF